MMNKKRFPVWGGIWAEAENAKCRKKNAKANLNRRARREQAHDKNLRLPGRAELPLCPAVEAKNFVSHPLLEDSPEGWGELWRRFRRRDADGCGRDDRAPEEVANDRRVKAMPQFNRAGRGKQWRKSPPKSPRWKKPPLKICLTRRPLPQKPRR
jgi:hypothetical protein